MFFHEPISFPYFFLLVKKSDIEKTKPYNFHIIFKGVFGTGAMGALAPPILKNSLLAPAIKKMM